MNSFESHAPENYVCPVCLGVQGIESDDTLIKSTDVVFKDEKTTAFINSFFMGRNAGHVIVVPNEHYESIYTLPPETGHRIFDVAQKIAWAMKSAYDCDGITTRQNNEPAGDQHAFHYHLHVYPRYDDDGFNNVLPQDKRLAQPSERAEYARMLAAVIIER